MAAEDPSSAGAPSVVLEPDTMLASSSAAEAALSRESSPIRPNRSHRAQLRDGRRGGQ